MEQQILNYRIERLLGEGGMSRVYLGVDQVTGQRVAIKVLHPHFADYSDVRLRFRREAQLMAKLNHPNIVHLIRYEENGNTLFLVQEYVDGVNLEVYLTQQRGLIPEKEAKELFCKLLEAIAYAHDNGVIHRDIKPANIIITKGSQITVVDFGIAKIAEGSVGGFGTKTGTRIGTVVYMSPEQVNGEEVDQRTDIYSLGVLLHQMLTGKPPYDSTTDSEFKVQVRIVTEPLPRMKGIYEHVSDGMQAVVDKATAKERKARYGNCNEFMQAIRAINSVMDARSDKPKIPFDKRIIAGVAVLLLAVLAVFGIMSASNSSRAILKSDAAIARSDSGEAVREEVARQKKRDSLQSLELAKVKKQRDSVLARQKAMDSLQIALKDIKRERDSALAEAKRLGLKSVSSLAFVPVVEYKIGEYYGGGIIFYVDGTGQHGLIAAASDMPGRSTNFESLWVIFPAS